MRLQLYIQSNSRNWHLIAKVIDSKTGAAESALFDTLQSVYVIDFLSHVMVFSKTGENSVVRSTVQNCFIRQKGGMKLPLQLS